MIIDVSSQICQEDSRKSLPVAGFELQNFSKEITERPQSRPGGRFTHFRKGDCPICSGKHKSCRAVGDLIFCRSGNPAPPGLRLTKQDQNGLFYIYVPGQETDFDKEAWEQRKREREAAQAQQRLKALSISERDRLYRQLPGHRQLTQRHRQELLKRRVTPEMLDFAVGQGWLRTWNRRIKVNFPCENLPGVVNGKTLGSDGIAIAGLSPNGKITGLQIAPDNKELAKYIWATSASKGGSGPHLPNGNLPLAIFKYPNHVGPVKVLLCEGFLKGLLTALQHWFEKGQTNVVVVGAAGGVFKGLQNVLTAFEIESIILCPDAGSPSNKAIMRNYRQAWEQCQDYKFSVAWWGQVSKSDGDIDEIPPNTEIKYLSWQEFISIGKQEEPATVLKKIQNLLLRRRGKRRPMPKVRLTQTGYVYQEGKRLETWQWAANQGYKFILDNSAPGLGKSDTAGRVHPQDLGVDRILYASTNHRNAPTETLKEWPDIEARHGGLVQEFQPDGSTRLRRKKSGEPYTVPGNCIRTKTLQAIRDKGIEGADTAGLICGGCKMSQACSRSEGDGFGYLWQRKAKLTWPRRRIHPDSLPNPIDFDYSQEAIIWDEPSEAFKTKKELTATWTDIRDSFATLAEKAPDVLPQVQAVLTQLLKLRESLPVFGFNNKELREKLPTTAINTDNLENALQPDLGFLDSTGNQYGVSLADLPQSLRSNFHEKDSTLARKAQELPTQWLSDFFKCLQGEQPGLFHLTGNGLKITTLNIRHRQIAKTANVNILLDATFAVEDAALYLGCKPSEIFVCYQQPPLTPNLKLIQVTGLGRLSMRRGPRQQERAAAVNQELASRHKNLKKIDFKRFITDSQNGSWWRDSRGSNAFVECDALVLTGSPIRNLADLQAEYSLLTGSHNYECEEFTQFVARRQVADLIQGFGRIRANRRIDEPLTVYFLTDDLPDWGAEIEQISAGEICPDAFNPQESLALGVWHAAKTLWENREAITQTALAELVGFCQQYISKHWDWLKEIISEFLDNRPPPIILSSESYTTILSRDISNQESSEKLNSEENNELVSHLGSTIDTLLGFDCSLEEKLRSVEDLILFLEDPTDRLRVWRGVNRGRKAEFLGLLLAGLGGNC